MNAIGIICELNPMHRGHCYLLDEAKKRADAVVCCMSGPFVQRGEPAVADKWDRAALTVRNGADLVLELPAAFALESARGFASGGVQTLAALPSVNALCFGVEEPADAEQLREAIRRIDEGHDAGEAEPLSFRRRASAALGEELLPNNILAMEYVRAIDRLGLSWEIEAVLRIGAGYHDADVESPVPSATAVRAGLRRGEPRASEALAPGTDPGTLLLDWSLDSLFEYLRWSELLRPIDFSKSPHYEPGLDQRFLHAMDASGSWEEAVSRASNKRHTASRVRRMLFTSLLGIRAGEAARPGYLRPLAMNRTGAALLRDSLLPVVQKPTLRSLSEEAERLFTIDLLAQRLYERLTGEKSGRDYLENPFLG